MNHLEKLKKALICSGDPDEPDNMGCANKRCKYRNVDGACDIVSICWDAATALSALMTENAQLRAEAEGMRSNWYKSVETVKQMRAELERLKSEPGQDACKRAPQHTYLFLTKNPKRYCNLANAGKLPQQDNFWYGSSVTHKGALAFTQGVTYNTFLSIEPLLENLDAGLGSFGDARVVSVTRNSPNTGR